MSASMDAHNEERIEELEGMLSELHQILGQFQDELPEVVIDKIMACLHGYYKDMWFDEYPDLLPWVRGE